MNDEKQETAPTRVVVGTSEPIKVHAVQSALAKAYPGEEWEVLRHKVPHGEIRQTFGIPAGFEAAQHRASYALKRDERILNAERREFPPAAYGIGIESTIIEGDIEVCCVIILPANWEEIDEKLYGRGLGSGLVIPPNEMSFVSEHRALADILDERWDHSSKKGIQTFLTNGAVSRLENYEIGVSNALAQINHPMSYEVEKTDSRVREDDGTLPRPYHKAVGR